jgi:protein-tyrosine phosphatase
MDNDEPKFSEHGVQHLYLPARNDCENYNTAQASVRDWLTQLMCAIADAERTPFPILFHCRAGRDRTGIAVAALLSILGVPETTIVAEFLLSDKAPRNMIELALQGFAKAGGIEKYFRRKVPLSAIRARFDEAAERLCASPE